MNKCPWCGNWSYDFDEYFGRFRCNSNMCPVRIVTSSEQREINLYNAHTQPKELFSRELGDLKIILKTLYDRINNILIFDFGFKGYTFDLPDSNNARVIWKIIPQSASIAGFIILHVEESVIEEKEIEIIASRKNEVERELKKLHEIVALGRATRLLVERIVSNVSHEGGSGQVRSEYAEALIEGLRKFKESQLSLNIA